LVSAADAIDAIAETSQRRDAVAAEIVRWVAELGRVRASLESLGDANVRGDGGRRLADRLVEIEDAIRKAERDKLRLTQKIPKLGERRDAWLNALGSGVPATG
jgi:hypothetical protein